MSINGSNIVNLLFILIIIVIFLVILFWILDRFLVIDGGILLHANAETTNTFCSEITLPENTSYGNVLCKTL